jgi:hypothetical protein
MHLLAEARRRPSVHPANLRLALPGVPHPRPFYSHGDLQYLEHGTRPMAAELDRLWRANGTMKGGTTRQGTRHDDDDWRAPPQGAIGLAPRRHSRTETQLYYPGLQDPPPGHDSNAGSGQ